MTTTRFSMLTLLILSCLVASSNGLVQPLASSQMLGSSSTSANLLSSSGNQFPTASRRQMSVLFSDVRANEDRIGGRQKSKGVWRIFLLKLSSVVLAASIIFSLVPAHAKRGGERFFTPEVEASVAALVQDAYDEVAFWYPEMDEIEAQPPSTQQPPSNNHPSPATTATLQTNRGGHLEAVALGGGGPRLVFSPKISLVSVRFWVVDSLLMLAAALLPTGETVDSLRQRFSPRARSTNSDWKKDGVAFLQSTVMSRLALLQQKWKMASYTITVCADASWAGLGLGLEEAAVLLSKMTDPSRKNNSFGGHKNENRNDLVYRFDYDAVESLLRTEPNKGVNEAMKVKDVSRQMSDKGAHKTVHDAMLQSSKKKRVSMDVETDQIQRNYFGLRRSNRVERQVGPPDRSSLSPKTSNGAKNYYVMLQRSSRELS